MFKPTRRQIIKSTAAVAAASVAFPFVNTRGARAADELNLFCWDGYSDPRLLDKFQKEAGVKVKPELLISDPDAINRLRAGETEIWDIINLNQPWARQVLWPDNLIQDIPYDRFRPYFDKMFDIGGKPLYWATSDDGNHLLGVVQRADTFDFGINTDVISWQTANDVGWDLFNDPAMKGRYGILAYDNWNIFHLCMTAGVDPFKVKTEDEVAKFEETTRRIVDGAKLITDDFVQINLAMLNGEIDAGFSSGTYSLSSARLDGNWNLVHVMPKDGPARGKGGVNWIELTSVVNNPDLHPASLDFLEFFLQPENSYIVATAGGVLNPVGQMVDPDVHAMFSADELRAISYYPEHDDYGHMGYEYRLSHAVQMDINPDYDRLHEIYLDARRNRG